MAVQSPRRENPFVDALGKLTPQAFDLIQDVVNSINGLQDADGFVYTIICGVRITVGVNSPEAVVVGSPPDLYLSSAGGAGTTLYYKSSGTATDTGWVAT